MDTLLFIAFGDAIALLVGVALGWIARGHVHDIADKAVSAANRAVTVPSDVIASIERVSPVAATLITQQTDELKAHITDTVNAAVTAAQKV